MHNYHDVYNTFPIGNRSSKHPTSGDWWRGHGWGGSFWISVLPYVEQAPLYNQMNLSGQSYGYTGQGVGNTVNGPLVRGLVFDFLKCPSSPLPTTKDTGGGINTQVSQYVGISGAVNDDLTANPNGFINGGSSQQFNSDNCCSLPAQGIHARGGVLTVGTAYSFKDMQDGTSNTMCVSEQSDFAKNNTGSTVQINNHHGWMMGTDHLHEWHGARHFNLTTVRYPPNAVKQKGGTLLPGVGNNDGANNGVFSPHTGGVQVALCDGSARFVSENVDLSTLKRLATRNDGQVMGEY